MRIERVTKDTIEIWSSLWQEQEKNIEGSFIRPMHKAYFQNKYQKTGKMKGYCVRKGEKAAAFLEQNMPGRMDFAPFPFLIL